MGGLANGLEDLQSRDGVPWAHDVAFGLAFGDSLGDMDGLIGEWADSRSASTSSTGKGWAASPSRVWISKRRAAWKNAGT